MIAGFGTHQRLVDSIEINYAIGGSGPPVLLLHGYPQTHLMWHRLAPELARDFTVICPDLRGYGDSAKPSTDDDNSHSLYSFRAMAQDMVGVMQALGFETFAVVGHDRGARVTHRMALDHESRVKRWCVIDIAPTLDMYEATNMDFATAYYHWFFLTQPEPLPERFIAAEPAMMLRSCLQGWSKKSDAEFDRVFPPEIMAEYLRCFSQPDAIHATCEDYRAAATIDLVHDREDRARIGKGGESAKIAPPCLFLWGENSLIGRMFDPLSLWRGWAHSVSGQGVAGAGHFVPEEQPNAVLEALKVFLVEG